MKVVELTVTTREGVDVYKLGDIIPTSRMGEMVVRQIIVIHDSKGCLGCHVYGDHSQEIASYLNYPVLVKYLQKKKEPQQ